MNQIEIFYFIERVILVFSPKSLFGVPKNVHHHLSLVILLVFCNLNGLECHDMSLKHVQVERFEVITSSFHFNIGDFEYKSSKFVDEFLRTLKVERIILYLN